MLGAIWGCCPYRTWNGLLPMAEWQELAGKLMAKGVKFVIEPKIRFAGEVGEQATMFFLDPSGNALEFKGFADFSSVFAK